MGDMLRTFVKQQTPIAQRIDREVLQVGGLAPSWFVSYLWMHELMRIDRGRNVIFDGSPRMLPEAQLLDDVLVWHDRVPPKVFLIDVTDTEATHRLLTRRVCESCKKIYLGDSPEAKEGMCECGGKLVKRHDDESQTIKNRLAYFKTDVEPVIEHYRKKGWLVRIDGEQQPEKVHKDVLDHLN